MLKSGNIFAVLAAIVGLGAAPAAGQAPSGNSLSGGGMMSSISAGDIVSMMTDFGVSTKLATPSSGGAPLVVATTSGGAMFLFHLIACQNEAQATGCQSALVTAALPSAGVTYDDLNNFNGAAAVTTAVNLPSQQAILFGRHIIVAGGHSRNLFASTVALFLNDVGEFARSRLGATSVGYSKGMAQKSKIGALQSPAPAAPKVFGLEDISAEISAAIANTNDVDFAVTYKPAQ
ncbi:MAG: hypothetical protein AB7P23_06210 [Amphiplicatus sp.]